MNKEMFFTEKHFLQNKFEYVIPSIQMHVYFSMLITVV